MNFTMLFSRSAVGALLINSLTLPHANAVIPQETVDQIRSMANPTLVLGGALDDAQGFYPEQGSNRFNDVQHVILDIRKDEGPTPSIRMDFNNLDELADLRATFPGHFSQIVLDWSTDQHIMWTAEHIRALYNVLKDDGEFYLPVPSTHALSLIIAGSENDPGETFLNAIQEVSKGSVRRGESGKPVVSAPANPQFRSRFYETASELAGIYELSVRERRFGQNWEQFIIPLQPARALVQLNKVSPARCDYPAAERNNIILEAANIEAPGYSPFDNFQHVVSYYGSMHANSHNRELLSSVFGDSLQVSYCSPNMNTIAEYPDLDDTFRTNEMRSKPFWLCKKESN
jgi:hypothetical protein